MASDGATNGTSKDAALEVGKSYEGVVTSIRHFGAKVEIPTDQRKCVGLVHKSGLLTAGKDVQEVLRKGQRVAVKVLGTTDGKINLTMKDVTQPDSESSPRGGRMSVGGPKVAAAAKQKLVDSPRNGVNGTAPTEPTSSHDLAKRMQRLEVTSKGSGASSSAKENNATASRSKPQSADAKAKPSYSSKPFKAPNSKLQLQKQSLPIYALRGDLMAAVKANQVLIVIGETGSGKTTQITQYLLEDGYAKKGRIGCTQPRRVAAISVARRVSEEMGCRLGDQVGYTIRFEDSTSDQTLIKYMTDGMLLRECLRDANLSAYSCIMLDEAHERSVNTDVLFGLLKTVVRQRPDFKLLIASATLEAEKFSEYFFNAPVFHIPGRTFPVQIIYNPVSKSTRLEEAAADAVMRIHQREGEGDILVFLTGQEEIDKCCDLIEAKKRQYRCPFAELKVLRCYSALPSDKQAEIFRPAPPGSRKVVVATNIAETSLTIDGMVYVIDAGFVKQTAFNAKNGMESLTVMRISQSSAQQRAGRAGRTQAGKCFRLYAKKDFDDMPVVTVPEIQRINLSSVVLHLKAMGIEDVVSFDFMDSPPHDALVAAVEQLVELGALDKMGRITELGRKMVNLPLDPTLAKFLILSSEMQCSEEVVTIVAVISAQYDRLFYRPKHVRELADAKIRRFHQPEGDLCTFLAVYNEWREAGSTFEWCQESFVQYRTLNNARSFWDVRRQLVGIMNRQELPLVTCYGNNSLVQRAICSAFARNVASLVDIGGLYRTLKGDEARIHPSSVLDKKTHSFRSGYVVYHEVIQTKQNFLRAVTVAKADWLPQYSKDALAKPGRTPGPSAKKPSKPDLPKNANHKRRVATKNFIASKHL